MRIWNIRGFSCGKCGDRTLAVDRFGLDDTGSLIFIGVCEDCQTKNFLPISAIEKAAMTRSSNERGN